MDIYSTWKSARLARENLIESCGLICSNTSATANYDQDGVPQVMHRGGGSDESFDHVENYAPRPGESCTAAMSCPNTGEELRMSYSDSDYRLALREGRLLISKGTFSVPFSVPQGGSDDDDALAPRGCQRDRFAGSVGFPFDPNLAKVMDR